MDKNTVLAIILSSVVLIGGLIIQQTFFPAPEMIYPEPAESQISTPQVSSNSISSSLPISTPYDVKENEDKNVESILEEKIYVIETELVRVKFTNRGGDIISYELLDHNDGNSFVQMTDNVTTTNRAFSLAFGDKNTNIIDDLFSVKIIDEYTIGFFKKFSITNSDGSQSIFTLAKQYSFKMHDYLFELDIVIDGEDNMKGLNFNNVGYVLRTPPQIGPYYNVKNDRYEYRRFLAYTKDKKKATTLNAGQEKTYTDRFKWIGVAGKYFTVLGVPFNNSIEKAIYSAKEEEDYFNSQVFMIRAPIIQRQTQDIYYFYIGPRTEGPLSIYNFSTDNPWKVSDFRLNDSLETSSFLGWLETALKWIMELFYKIIPNWGISIILMTILTKLILFPLTKKSSMSTLKMQELQPKMKEIQTKYKDNPEKMNMEIAKMYKDVGYNPLSGCLPLLIQFPLIIAMYNLFNNYFEFRGAMFIPGWIPDLSVGDSIYTFPFDVPFIGNQLRLLPIIYVISQLIYGKITQSPGAATQTTSMKIMMYGMPLFFFFIFYNAPSGLLLYWTFSNILSMVQQVIINKTMRVKMIQKNIADKNRNQKISKKSPRK